MAVDEDGDNSIDYIINNPITNYIQYDRFTTSVYSWQKGLQKNYKVITPSPEIVVGNSL